MLENPLSVQATPFDHHPCLLLPTRSPLVFQTLERGLAQLLHCHCQPGDTRLPATLVGVGCLHYSNTAPQDADDQSKCPLASAHLAPCLPGAPPARFSSSLPAGPLPRHTRPAAARHSQATGPRAAAPRIALPNSGLSFSAADYLHLLIP